MTAYPEAAAELAKPINELLPMLLTYNDKPTWIKYKASYLIQISSIHDNLIHFVSSQFNSTHLIHFNLIGGQNERNVLLCLFFIFQMHNQNKLKSYSTN